MRILICGDRKWNNSPAIARELVKIAELKPTIIEGEANGADSIAGYQATRLGLEVLKFPADWKKYGKAAGPIRNMQMLKEGKPDIIWAFHSDIENSKGTKNMVTIARKAGIEVLIFKE